MLNGVKNLVPLKVELENPRNLALSRLLEDDGVGQRG
jgi:hypothetical protein